MKTPFDKRYKARKTIYNNIIIDPKLKKERTKNFVMFFRWLFESDHLQEEQFFEVKSFFFFFEDFLVFARSGHNEMLNGTWCKCETRLTGKTKIQNFSQTFSQNIKIPLLVFSPFIGTCFQLFQICNIAITFVI